MIAEGVREAKLRVSALALGQSYPAALLKAGRYFYEDRAVNYLFKDFL